VLQIFSDPVSCRTMVAGSVFSSLRCRKRAVYLFLSCRCLSSSASALKVAVLTGTTRLSGPPRPVLGPRVCEFIVQGLERRGITVTVLDPRELEIPLLDKPEFSYSRSQVPKQLKEMQETLASVDAYVAITPEYNHAPSPALINMLNHFGSSTFSFKPSAIVSYSAGQWGGTRAAIGLRPILSELGCLPVSAMIHIPKAQEVLEEDGSVCDGEAEKWDSYLDRCFAQLEWWGEAARIHREQVDPYASSPAFKSTPSERNAP
jgi:chromate reductase